MKLRFLPMATLAISASPFATPRSSPRTSTALTDKMPDNLFLKNNTNTIFPEDVPQENNQENITDATSPEIDTSQEEESYIKPSKKEQLANFCKSSITVAALRTAIDIIPNMATGSPVNPQKSIIIGILFNEVIKKIMPKLSKVKPDIAKKMICYIIAPQCVAALYALGSIPSGKFQETFIDISKKGLKLAFL